jgi:diguanylate cyclase (GGDEF)-like protein
VTEPSLQASSPSAEVILVVDDDQDIARFVEVNLQLHGFEVLVAHDGEQALAIMQERKPDLAVVDVRMPRVDGLELTRRLRADPMTSALPIIMLTAKGLSVDKVVGLTAGADDYLVKPFDTSELVARVRSTLRRTQEFREVSPLTGLPGNNRILREIADRVRGGTDYAVCYIDIDRFKSVNDAYGFGRGDEFIAALAQCLHKAVVETEAPPAFLGHVGGDDFVIVCLPGQVQAIAERAAADFERAVENIYNPEDAQRGYLELVDRRGNVQRPNLVTISVGVALSTSREYTDPREVIAVATEMKNVAKKEPGSFVAYDRRRSRHVSRSADPGVGR